MRITYIQTLRISTYQILALHMYVCMLGVKSALVRHIYMYAGMYVCIQLMQLIAVCIMRNAKSGMQLCYECFIEWLMRYVYAYAYALIYSMEIIHVHEIAHYSMYNKKRRFKKQS